MASSERTEGTIASSGAEAGAEARAPAGAAANAGFTGSRDQAGPAEATNSSGPVAGTALERARISCDMNARYHACREAFLDTLHRWFMFGIIACGAAAIFDILPHGYEWVKGAFAALAAMFGALDLTFDLSNRARMHALMKRRYFELLADVIEGKKTLEAMQATINRYNADEEPAYHALLGSCWNAAQKMVYGPTAIELFIPRHHRWAKNWFRFAASKYEPQAAGVTAAR